MSAIETANALGHDVWVHKGLHVPFRYVMPIITPVYPAFNSTHNVSLATREVMTSEFQRGQTVCQQIFGQTRPDFASLAAPFDIFREYKKFIFIQITGKEEEDFKRWQGWVVARTRLLVNQLQDYLRVRPYPEALTPPPPDDADGTREHFQVRPIPEECDIYIYIYII